MASQKIINIIKERPGAFKALEEFEKTGKVITKTRMNFTIDREIARQFKEFCRKNGYNMSSIVEQSIKKIVKKE
jgi:hypothetical protein